MWSTIMKLFKAWRKPMEYHREIINTGHGSMHIVHVNGMLNIYSYDEQLTGHLDGCISTVFDSAIELAKRMQMPVRYYYRGFNSGNVEYVQYDYGVRSIRMCHA